MQANIYGWVYGYNKYTVLFFTFLIERFFYFFDKQLFTYKKNLNEMLLIYINWFILNRPSASDYFYFDISL